MKKIFSLSVGIILWFLSLSILTYSYKAIFNNSTSPATTRNTPSTDHFLSWNTFGSWEKKAWGRNPWMMWTWWMKWSGDFMRGSWTMLWTWNRIRPAWTWNISAEELFQQELSQ